MDAANEPNNLFTLRRRAGLTRAQLAHAAWTSRAPERLTELLDWSAFGRVRTL